MKRILCIISSLSAGGAETFLMKLSRALPPEEYQLDFIVSVAGGCYTNEVLRRGGRVYTIPERTKNFFGAFRGITSTVKENNYDTVLKLAENSLAVADLIAARLGGAKVLALRSCNAPTGLSFTSRIIHRLLRPLLNLTATVRLAPSMLAAEFMFGKRRANKDVHILNNGLDLKEFRYDEDGRQSIRDEFSLNDHLVVGHVGRFHEQKNHLYLTEVFSRIKAQRNDAVLLLVGIGQLEDTIRARVKELGLKSSVIFAGQRFDISQMLSAMDVFVFPSFYEGMPNTVIEAQATGLPCIISDTITRDANITGLIQYLSLDCSPEYWAKTAISAVTTERPDTARAFTEHGYDIESVAMDLLHQLDCQ